MPARQAQETTRSGSVPMLTAGGARAEHISLGSDPALAPGPATARNRKVRAAYELTSALRGCSTRLSLLEEHFVAVQSTRPGSEPNDYVVDLRFANAKPVLVRHIAWTWLALMLAFGLLTVAAGWLYRSAQTPPIPTALVGAAMLGGAAVSLLMFLRQTTESLQFTSVHGQATLIGIMGGIGSARAGKQFFVNLIKSINAAKAARPQSKQEFLRDEMREHHRLRELGVLSQQEYEASKMRILASHA